MENKRVLTDEAYQKIKELILDQKLAPGQKLTYGDLSKRLDMSPTPIINALYRMEHEGFVASVPFKGFYVRKMGLQEAWELFGIREALETYIVEQAILVAEPRDLERLEERFAEHAAYRPEVYDRKRFMLDSEFHMELARLSKNEALVQQLLTTFEHFYIRFKFSRMSLDRLESSVDEHRQLIDRIRRKDINGSRDAIRNHIHNARNHIIQSLSDETSPDLPPFRLGGQRAQAMAKV
ncbi:MAG: GntR family transcriptional regulator [Gammaproteobacteria bacterium]|nr:GntR family transcriptional regulator [Gammaproteobacteria bacterium]MDH4255396.1 GntR family transcriptional regulator [Gammaproteobacteria bacterium]